MNNGFVNTHSGDKSPSSLPVPDALDLLSPGVSDTLSEGHRRSVALLEEAEPMIV